MAVFMCIYYTAGSLFFLEISAGIMRRDYPKEEWDETWTRHAREGKQTADSSHVFKGIHTCQNNLIN